MLNKDIDARIAFKTAWIYLQCLCLFSKYRERIQKFGKTSKLKNLYRNEVEKACFAIDAVCFNLAERTISAKILKDRAYEIARNCKCDGYQRTIVSMVYKIFYKKTGSGVSIHEQLAEELDKKAIKKFKWIKVLIIFGRQIQLKWDLCPQRIKMLNIYYVW